jgi:hypothetical protein
MPHAVQLFDGDATRVRAVAAFVREGLVSDERVVVVMRLASWTATAAELERDLDLRRATESGRLTVLDSDSTLERLLRDGKPDAEHFDAVIGSLVAANVPGIRGLRAYGEMVDLLAAERDFAGAQRLEALWNDLRARTPFSLFCGYSSMHFPGVRDREALRAIRRLHTHTHLHPGDIIGTHLMEAAGV